MGKTFYDDGKKRNLGVQSVNCFTVDPNRWGLNHSIRTFKFGITKNN